MQTRVLISTLAGACLSATLMTRAQDLAPASLAGALLTVTVVQGQAPFASSGGYRLFTSVAGSNYVVLGRAGPLSAGAYTYAKSGPDRGAMALAEAGGASFPGQLSFSSPTNGTLALTNAAGFQTGTFTLATYAKATAPGLFLSSVAGGQFQSVLSGQPGSVYAIETSTNLAKWQAWREVPLTDWTANFADATGRAACFYRARVSSTAFAPAI
jgi:hypothetical protein